MSTRHVESALSQPSDEVGRLLVSRPCECGSGSSTARTSSATPITSSSSKSGGVHLTLLAELTDRALDARLSARARAVMAALRERGRLSTGEVAEMLDVSRPVAQRELGALREFGVIEWVGKSPRDPRAFWRLRSN